MSNELAQALRVTKKHNPEKTPAQLLTLIALNVDYLAPQARSLIATLSICPSL